MKVPATHRLSDLEVKLLEALQAPLVADAVRRTRYEKFLMTKRRRVLVAHILRRGRAAKGEKSK